MHDNPFAGVGLHAAGGVAHGSFYVPLKWVRGWAWESAWLLQGLMAWVVMPWLVALLANAHPWSALALTSPRVVLFTALAGAMWGAGSLTFGLSVRFLGISLGQAVALGYTMSLGTLVPPLVQGTFSTLLENNGGRLVLLGIAVCLVGIALCGVAGLRREREQSTGSTASRTSVLLGLAVATFSGIMSAGFAFGIQSGQPIAETALREGAPVLFKNSAVFVVIMAGGFLVNCAWCVVLGWRNRTLGDLVNRSNRSPDAATLVKPGARTTWRHNCICALGSGATWYVGFMLYGMGTTFMGRFDFTSWPIHLAFVIVFSTLCGIIGGEWRGVSARTMRLVTAALVILVASTFIVALGNRLATQQMTGSKASTTGAS